MREKQVRTDATHQGRNPVMHIIESFRSPIIYLFYCMYHGSPDFTIKVKVQMIITKREISRRTRTVSPSRHAR